MKNESFERKYRTEQEASVDSIVQMLEGARRGSVWTHYALGAAMRRANDQLTQVEAQGGLQDVFIEAGGSPVYCESRGEYLPVHLDEDAVLYGRMEGFVQERVINDETRRKESRLYMSVASYDDNDIDEYWIPVAVTGARGLEVNIASVPDVLSRGVAAHEPAERTPSGLYRELAEELLLAQGGMPSQELMSVIEEKVASGEIADLDELSTDFNMTLCEAEKNGEMLSVEFFGDAQTVNQNGEWTSSYRSACDFPLVAIEFYAMPATLGGVGAHAYMVDENDTIIRADMYEDNFYISIEDLGVDDDIAEDTE